MKKYIKGKLTNNAEDTDKTKEIENDTNQVNRTFSLRRTTQTNKVLMFAKRLLLRNAA